MAIIIYGIPNCDTVKKLRKIMDQKSEYTFVDFKKTPPTIALLNKWKEELGDFPVNPRGTTFREIREEYEGASLEQKQKLLIENTSALKRPLVEVDGKLYSVGFDQEKIASLNA